MAINKNKTIGFLTVTDPLDRRSWSGTYYYMAEALKRNCGLVVYLGPIETHLEGLGKFLNKLSCRIFGKCYDYKRSRWYARRLSKIAERRISAQQLDYIVAPAAASVLAYLRKDRVPVVYISDTTFALIYNYYANFSEYLSLSVSDGHHLAKSAMQISDIVSFPSQWAADSAISDYDIPFEKVHVIPFGANLDKIPSAEIAMKRQLSGKCRLLFIGVDWIRKGGDIALETLLALEKKHGIKAHLTVCGCQPPAGVWHDRMYVVGFLNKQEPEQAKQPAAPLSY
jgi:glycosyltransferase involved in cell wall biosynthesis